MMSFIQITEYEKKVNYILLVGCISVYYVYSFNRTEGPLHTPFMKVVSLGCRGMD